MAQVFHADDSPYTKKTTPGTILRMKCGAFYIPKANPSKPLGEDAYFISEMKQIIGVADGVGGWSAKGIDAGKYARQLMRNCVTTIIKESPSSSSFIDPRKVLVEAYSNTTAAGSSTACIVSFDGKSLRAANVGDSGFMIFRNKRIVYESPVQQHNFNRPYQLGQSPDSDRPESAWKGRFESMMAGDIIVMGTDGLLDNVFAYEIEKIIDKDEKGMTKPRELARKVAALALYNAYNEFYESPFAVGAREVGLNYNGGKIDDITVIVAKIVASDSSS